MIVAKFGGSSLAGPREFLRVAEIVLSEGIDTVIVSAPGGENKVTDLLIAAYKKWEECGDCKGREMDDVIRRFTDISSAAGIDLSSRLVALIKDINAGCGFDYAVSRGEYLCALILARLTGYRFVDAAECVKLTLSGSVDFDSVKAHIGSVDGKCVVPGFYGKMPNGRIRLLPRGGSDISGALIAAAKHGVYQKRTDVPGIFNGHGAVMDRLSYDEAEMLCYFGANVMHYGAIPILKSAKTPLVVKSAFCGGEGTEIGEIGYDGYASSFKEMFFGGDETYRHLGDITGEGLTVAHSYKLLNSGAALIDGCGFSPLALKRILRYPDIKRVKATFCIGKRRAEANIDGRLLLGSEHGDLYIKEL